MKKLLTGLSALLLMLPNAYAQDEQSQEKMEILLSHYLEGGNSQEYVEPVEDENSISNKVNRVFDLARTTSESIVNNENVKATIKTTKETGKTFWANKSRMLYNPKGYCAKLQNSEDFIKHTWFTEDLGVKIQDALEAGDPYVIKQLPNLHFIVKKKDLDFVDTTGFNPLKADSFQIETWKMQFHEPLEEFKYKDFSDRWSAYFAKDLTFLVKSYRCPDDHWFYNGQGLSNAIKSALNIAIYLGDDEARTRLQKYLPK